MRPFQTCQDSQGTTRGQPGKAAGSRSSRSAPSSKERSRRRAIASAPPYRGATDKGYSRVDRGEARLEVLFRGAGEITPGREPQLIRALRDEKANPGAAMNMPEEAP